MVSLVSIYLFIIFPLLSHQKAVYLFNTEDNDNVEYYDCLFIDVVPYCRRPGFPVRLRRNNISSICDHQGTRRTFEYLRNSTRTFRQILHNFRSSIEKVEEYVLYLSGHSESNSICECYKTSFGKNCEYQLLVEGRLPTFADSRIWQNLQKQQNRFAIHAFQKTLCYENEKCNFGLLCLDWRDICDGRQQCLDGIDEELCDFLEFNECEKDEYRCANGMCIPNHYFLDGEYDCMDSSDERQVFNSNECAYQLDTFHCDEHLCLTTEWSCGDGQCINEINRYDWKENVTISHRQCFSMREYLFLCELSDDYDLWTSIHGRCYHPSAISINDNQTKNDYCIYLVKCALTNGIEKNCPCRRDNCASQITEHCPSSIQYPSKELLTPYLIGHYNRNRTWSRSKQPDYYRMMGSIKCYGYHARTNINISIPFENMFLWRHIALDKYFCKHENISKNLTGSQFHPLCYSNESHVLGNDDSSSYAFLNVCDQCLSQYRMRDGMKDCVEGEDELLEERNTCDDRVYHHRYHCLSNRNACLMINTLGDSITQCNNSDDEFVYGTGQSLSTIQCQQYQDENCQFLREYISNSRLHLNNNKKERMQFRLYCNTFWNLPDRSDESSEICRSWKCSQGEYQCRTGQCIPKHYVCDNEWDCSDASDELFDTNDFNDHNRETNLRESQMTCAVNRRQGIQLFDGVCNLTKEYPCLLINLTQKLSRNDIRPCISFDQIGDTRIDCLGGIDERNTLQHCHRLHQLGFAFKCSSTSEQCFNDEDLCTNINQCSDRNNLLLLCGDDNEEGCSDWRDFHCLNGSCVKHGRCNGHIDCNYGEDEYWCHSKIDLDNSKDYRLIKQRNQLSLDKFIRLSYPSEVKTWTTEETIGIRRNASENISSSISRLICNRE